MSHISTYQSINRVPAILKSSLRSPPTIRSLVMPAAVVSGLLVTQNYLWFLSLRWTITAVNTTLYQSQCVWVMLFSMCFLGATPSLSKMASVALAVIGIAMISLFGHETEDNADIVPCTLGVVLCVAASMVSGLMQVMMSKFERQHFAQNDASQKLRDLLFFKFMVGAAVLVMWWPMLIVLDSVGLETFALPASLDVWLKLAFFVAVTVPWIMSYLVAITYCGALFISVGSLMVVPISYAVDIWLYDLTLSTSTIMGSLCVVAAFVLMQRRGGGH